MMKYKDDLDKAEAWLARDTEMDCPACSWWPDLLRPDGVHAVNCPEMPQYCTYCRTVHKNVAADLRAEHP